MLFCWCVCVYVCLSVSVTLKLAHTFCSHPSWMDYRFSLSNLFTRFNKITISLYIYFVTQQIQYYLVCYPMCIPLKMSTFSFFMLKQIKFSDWNVTTRIIVYLLYAWFMYINFRFVLLCHFHTNSFLTLSHFRAMW